MKMMWEGDRYKMAGSKTETGNEIYTEEFGRTGDGLSPQKRGRLKEIIKERALIVKEDSMITLASGKESNFFFDMKTVLLSPKSANLITEELLKKLQGVQFDYVGGMESGAIPIVALICANNKVLGRDIEGFYVRKNAKSHGERRSGSDKIDGNLKSDSEVVIVDDVTTTGGSIMAAIKEVKQIGCKIVKVITVVDRGQGAKEKLAEEGIELDALFTAEDFGL